MLFLRSLKKAMVSILLVPLLFSLVVLSTLYLLFYPFVNLALQTASGVIAAQAPDFDPELASIFEDKNLIERNTVPLSEVDIPPIGTHYANISIKRVDLQIPLYWGDTEKILRHGAGQFIGSFLPGFQRPLLIAGHNLSVMYPLKNVEVSDEVVIKTNYGEYTYVVDEIAIKKETDPTFYDLSLREERLIMYTCYPFRILASRNYDRYIVYGHRISGPDIR